MPSPQWHAAVVVGCRGGEEQGQVLASDQDDCSGSGMLKQVHACNVMLKFM